MADRSMPTGRIRRTMPLAGFTARAAGGRVVAALRKTAGDADAVDRFHERTAERYADLLGHSKGVLMKAGQMVSMIDAGAVGFGELSPYQRALTRLQGDAPPMAAELARGMVESELGCSLHEVFADFSDRPMAAASIGQVHRATLADGRDVAVKVQYPGVAEAIRDDLANTELITTFVRFMNATAPGSMPDLRLASQELTERISEELDYRHEAANISAFGELYRGHPFIRIPEVITEASADRVLTMTYLDGMNWEEALTADQDLKNVWAEAISRMLTGSYRHANLFHADPHPGNYRFGSDGTVGFVDFGCVKVFSESKRWEIVRTARAVVEGRADDLYAVMDESGFFDNGCTLTPVEVYEWYSNLMHELIAPQPVTYGHESAERTVRSMLDVRSGDHPVRRMSVPPDFVFLSRLNLSMNSIFSAMGATFHARASLDDMDGIIEPVSDLGKRHIAWVRQRGLPFGMDRR